MLTKLPRLVVWWLIRGYQLSLSAFIGRTCRFEPSCSHYAQEAVMRFGVWRGGWLAAKRVARCGPFGGSGYDPVPERGTTGTEGTTGTKGKDCGCGGH